jgi:hypothetical protein
MQTACVLPTEIENVMLSSINHQFSQIVTGDIFINTSLQEDKQYLDS